MNKPEPPEQSQRTPAEEWTYLSLRLQGILVWTIGEAARLYPRKLEQLTNEQLIQEARSKKALEKAAVDFMADVREFYARVNGKVPPPPTHVKEAKK